MERFLVWMRDNPQWVGLAFALVVLLVLAGVLGFSMARAGVSLRPLIWFFGFIAIIAGPQAVVHLLDGYAVYKSRTEAVPPGDRAVEGPIPEGPGLAPVPWEKVFGPGADPSLMVDARQGLAPVLAGAEDSKLSFQADGTSALAARFASEKEASAALNRYGTFFGFSQAEGSDATGWTAKRYAGQGEWNHVVVAGPELYAWTGPSREVVVAARERALGAWSVPVAGSSPSPGAAGPAVYQSPVGDRLRNHKGLMAAILVLNLVAAVLWFFKGSAWVARADAAAGILPLPAESLRGRLLELNRSGLPTEVTLLETGNKLSIQWRYTDAKWIDLMRARSVRKIHRLVLELDEPARTVRVLEYTSAFDASAGADGVKVEWRAGMGIQFFAFEQQRMLGLVLGPDGKPTGEWSTGYTFNLAEFKAPYLQTVTRAGWHWQPLVWDTPRWLRPLLEN